MNERVSLVNAMIKKRCKVVEISFIDAWWFDIIHKLNILGIGEGKEIKKLSSQPMKHHLLWVLKRLFLLDYCN